MRLLSICLGSLKMKFCVMLMLGKEKLQKQGGA